MRRLSTIFAAIALALAALGGYFAISRHVDRPSLSIDQAERELGQFPLGESDVTFHISNSSSRPARIVGAAFG